VVADPAAEIQGSSIPDVPTKSGIMLGLGETMEQVQGTLRDLRAHDVDMVTIGQYLQPTPHHHPVMRYWTPEEFKALEEYGMRWASATSPPGRWCAPPTTPTAGGQAGRHAAELTALRAMTRPAGAYRRAKRPAPRHGHAFTLFTTFRPRLGWKGR
jgi:hypothetical protein